MNASEAQSLLQQEISPAHRVGPGMGTYTLRERPGHQLVVSVDTLVSGVHFPESTPPGMIAHKSLAVNLSDIAAMGGEATGFTLGLSCPDFSSDWFHAFREGLRALSNRFKVGMLSCVVEPGPLSITVQVYGHVPRGQALLRSTAQAGDAVYVSGHPGDAAGALALLLEKNLPENRIPPALLQRLNTPEPRMSLGQALRGIASACIDVSDGLLADLGHILEQSGKGAVIELEKIPVSDTLQQIFSREKAQALAQNGGDDYELCFTVPPGFAGKVEVISKQLDIPCTCIGMITAENVLRLLDAQGKDVRPGKPGYDHFSGTE